jgi:Tfp pilus assembly protein PilF
MEQRPPPKPEAYTLYLAAKEELRALRPGGFVRAAAGLERAVAIDPSFAAAWVALARAHRHLAFVAGGPTARAEISRRALADAERAVSLDQGLAEAWSARGLARLEADFDLQGARSDLERALALSPSDPGSHARYSYLLAARGQHQEAIREARAAAELDPLASWWTSLGTAHLAAGDLKGAEAAYRRQLDVLPAGTLARYPVARTLLLQGRLEEARALIDQIPEEGYRQWLRGAIGHRRGDEAAARVATDAYLRLEGPAEEFEAACLLAFTGRKAEALDWLQRALSIRHPSLVLELGWSPWLEGPRAEPRFVAVQREVQALVDRARR